MSKNEFMEYIRFLKELFPRANIPTSKEGLNVWYKAFENTHINVAKEMTQMYLQEEQNGFNYARLLAYKSRAMANKNSTENGSKFPDTFKLITDDLLKDKIFECGAFKIKRA